MLCAESPAAPVASCKRTMYCLSCTPWNLQQPKPVRIPKHTRSKTTAAERGQPHGKSACWCKIVFSKQAAHNTPTILLCPRPLVGATLLLVRLSKQLNVHRRTGLKIQAGIHDCQAHDCQAKAIAAPKESQAVGGCKQAQRLKKARTGRRHKSEINFPLS